MKKAFPVLWRYILVVITSCALAFFISQNTAKAAEFQSIKNSNGNIGGHFKTLLPQKPPRIRTLDVNILQDSVEKIYR
jgi:hypothetical protein